MLAHYKILQAYKENDISPVTGILLHGPPGCGKTYLAHAIAGEIGIPIIEVSATSNESDSMRDRDSMNLTEAFIRALDTGRCILLIDKIDAMLGSMVTQMITFFNELREKDPDGNIVVIGITNWLYFVDNELRRNSRFEDEIFIGMPDEKERLEILEVICNDVSPDFDFSWLAHHTQRYVAADLKTLSSIAEMKALYRVDVSVPPDQTGDNVMDYEKYRRSLPLSEECPDKKVIVTLDDFKVALQEYVPIAKREVPDTTWDDIGSYEDIKRLLQKTIVWPVQHREFYENNKLLSRKGVLLYGPKGCGKTMLAKAIANECSINFLAVNGYDLLSMHVGEAEKALKKCFEKAWNSSPSILFFDDIDALCPPKSNSKENVAMERVVNQLLTETSRISERQQVFLVATTNRPDKIDSAMLRPGRFDKKIYVGLPNPAGRVEILKSHLKGRTLEEGFEVEKVAFDPRCEHFSGADISNLVDEACSNAAEELKILGHKLENKLVLCRKHFDQAFTEIQPSISEQERRYYEKICLELS